MCVGVLKGSHSNHRVLGTIGGARVSMDHAVAFQRDSFPSGHTNTCAQQPGGGLHVYRCAVHHT